MPRLKLPKKGDRVVWDYGTPGTPIRGTVVGFNSKDFGSKKVLVEWDGAIGVSCRGPMKYGVNNWGTNLKPLPILDRLAELGSDPV